MPLLVYHSEIASVAVLNDSGDIGKGSKAVTHCPVDRLLRVHSVVQLFQQLQSQLRRWLLRIPTIQQ